MTSYPVWIVPNSRIYVNLKLTIASRNLNSGVPLISALALILTNKLMITLEKVLVINPMNIINNFLRHNYKYKTCIYTHSNYKHDNTHK